MLRYLKPHLLARLAAAALFGLASLAAHSDDIDLFIGSSAGTADDPNVLIILDNSSNWAAANQGWPTDTSPPVNCGNDCNKQGYYELKAIRTVVSALPADASGNVALNLGLMLFNNTTATRDGGYIRYAVRRMDSTNKAAFLARIDQIITNFNTDTAASSVQYSAALFDAFKYFGGYTNPTLASQNQAPSTNPDFNSVPVFGTRFWGSNDADGTKPDSAAYSGSNYVPPSVTSCGKNFIIFIGNGFPAQEASSFNMSEALEKLKNPSSPASSTTEFALASFVCSGTWANAAGYSCGSSASCTAEKPVDSPTLLYRCDSSNCTGSNRRVQSCSSVSTIYTSPSSNARNRYADEFTDFLYNADVSSLAGRQPITTYTIDVFKDQPSTDQTALMRNMATKGGGKYFAASNADAIVNALKEIFQEIQSVNSTFASASLPINATNRSQSANQVFIGMLRPDPTMRPRWFGNLKRYQLITTSTGGLDLGDVNGNPAINLATGFVADCAKSWWTTDSGNYWQAYTINPNPASPCTTSSFNAYSDAPDGSRVEKGAVAEVLRKGNQPPYADGLPARPWTPNRTLKSASGAALTTFNATNTGLSTTLVDWMLGKDTQDENIDGTLTESRPSIHGDVAHSRPLPVNYCSASSSTCDNVVVYYGANDGTYRAVRSSDGKELWAFVAPEFNSKLDRLRTQSPGILLFGQDTTGITPTPTPRDYFWDGSTGLYQNADNSQVWIYPVMRRGGRMIYALDVTVQETPALKWKFGCPHLTNDTDCTTDASTIGQTWSTPNIAFIKGYSTTRPVIIVGGGYDACDDANTATPSCSSAKGNRVFVLDAADGSVVASLTTAGSVASDISLVDMDRDGYPDFAYVGDVRGNLYRISFTSYDASTGTYPTRAAGDWVINRVAYTTGGSRKFLFSPAVFGVQGLVYVTIGSGDREHPLQAQYPYTTPVENRFYMYRDCLPAIPATSSITGGDDLDNESLMNAESATAPVGCDAPKTVANNCSSNKGWFMRLNNGTGEQTVTSSLIAGGMVTFSTNRPIPAAEGTCATSLGEARGYWLNLYNGSGAMRVDGNCGGVASGVFVGGGLPPSPVFGTVPINGVVTDTVMGAIQRDGGASSSIAPQRVAPTNLPARKRIYSIIKGDN